MCLCLCEMHVKAIYMAMYNYALSLWAMEQKVGPQKYFVVKKICRIPQETKYFIMNNFYTKISNGEFSQTTVIATISIK